MAINQVLKRQNLAAEVMDLVDTFMTNLELASNRASEYASSGVTFVDSDMESSDALKHFNASDLTTAITNINSLVTHLSTNSIDDVFNKIRP